jgi:hypothetical protein
MLDLVGITYVVSAHPKPGCGFLKEAGARRAGNAPFAFVYNPSPTCKSTLYKTRQDMRESA